AAERPADIVRQYHVLERALKQQWHESPSPETHELARALTARFQSAAGRPAAASAPSSSPPDAGTDLPRGLPMRMTRFFGREREISDLCARLSTLDSPLITLTGPGGGGKTRLAIEAAGRLAKTFGR